MSFTFFQELWLVTEIVIYISSATEIVKKGRRKIPKIEYVKIKSYF